MNPIGRRASLLACEALLPYADASTWFTDRDAIERVLGDHSKDQATNHWLAILEKADVWCADALDWNRLMAHEAFQTLDILHTIEFRKRCERHPQTLQAHMSPSGLFRLRG